jgi:hypothetical protein
MVICGDKLYERLWFNDAWLTVGVFTVGLTISVIPAQAGMQRLLNF